MKLLRQLGGIARRLPSPVRRPLKGVATKFSKDLLGVAHPWDDLIELAKAIRPAAVLDLGAHIGEAAIELSRACPWLPIHAFEPTPKSFSILQGRIARYPNITAYQVAIDEVTGRRRLHLNANEQTNSLLENDADNNTLISDKTAHVAVAEVDTITLDDWLQAHLSDGMILIKADIQGAEGKLIAGGRNAFSTRVAAILTEASIGKLYMGAPDFFDLHRIFTTEFHLVLAQLYASRRVAGLALWTDALWVHPDHSAHLM